MVCSANWDCLFRGDFFPFLWEKDDNRRPGFLDNKYDARRDLWGRGVDARNSQ